MGKVKILCVSDEVDPLVYSQNVKERYREAAFVIGAGDLRMRYYGFIVSSLNKPLYFVFGNHHLSQYKYFIRKERAETIDMGYESFSRNYFGSTCISERVVRDKRTGLIMTGFGGSFRYNNGQNQYTDTQMYWKVISRLPKMLYYRLRYGRWVDIVVTHAPPAGIHDKEDICHRGFKAFLWFMRVFKPRYLLHGHVHLLDMNQKRVERYHETEVINVFKSHILEVEV